MAPLFLTITLPALAILSAAESTQKRLIRRVDMQEVPKTEKAPVIRRVAHDEEQRGGSNLLQISSHGELLHQAGTHQQGFDNQVSLQASREAEENGAEPAFHQAIEAIESALHKHTNTELPETFKTMIKDCVKDKECEKVIANELLHSGEVAQELGHAQVPTQHANSAISKRLRMAIKKVGRHADETREYANKARMHALHGVIKLIGLYAKEAREQAKASSRAAAKVTEKAKEALDNAVEKVGQHADETKEHAKVAEAAAEQAKGVAEAAATGGQAAETAANEAKEVAAAVGKAYDLKKGDPVLEAKQQRAEDRKIVVEEKEEEKKKTQESVDATAGADEKDAAVAEVKAKVKKAVAEVKKAVAEEKEAKAEAKDKEKKAAVAEDKAKKLAEAVASGDASPATVQKAEKAAKAAAEAKAEADVAKKKADAAKADAAKAKTEADAAKAQRKEKKAKKAEVGKGKEGAEKGKEGAEEGKEGEEKKEEARDFTLPEQVPVAEKEGMQDNVEKKEGKQDNPDVALKMTDQGTSSDEEQNVGAVPTQWQASFPAYERDMQSGAKQTFSLGLAMSACLVTFHMAM